jgi:hypothetical protein
LICWIKWFRRCKRGFEIFWWKFDGLKSLTSASFISFSICCSCL